MLDRPPSSLQAGVEGVELGHVALVQAELTELGEDLLAQAVAVGAGRRVRPAGADLAHPDVGSLAEAGLGPQHLGTLAPLGA
jgi:hypothetical protein